MNTGKLREIFAKHQAGMTANCAAVGVLWDRGNSKALSLVVSAALFSGSVLFSAAAAAQGSSAPGINVLTLDDTRTLICGGADFNIVTGDTFVTVHGELQNPSNFGTGGIVDRAVDFMPSVSEINSASLMGADVVLLSLNRVPLSICELLDLAEFVNQGGGLFVFANEAADIHGPLYGAVSTSAVGTGATTIDDSSSPMISGPFGVVSGPLGTLGFHRVFDQVGPNGNSVLSTMGTVMASFDHGLGEVSLIADEEWCADLTVSGCLAGQLPNGDRQTLFLNSFASIVPPTNFAYQSNPQCVGNFYCDPASTNTRGLSATIRAVGSESAAANQLTLHAEGMPFNEMGFFLNGTASGQYSPPNSDGTICLIGAGIGRYNGNPFQPGTGQVLSSGSLGSFSLQLDLPNTPTPQTPVAISAGQTWRFQAWYRDGMSNNFTDALTVQFQ